MDSITRIKNFIAVVDEGGFSAAARRHGRSKALVSKYVRELEDELGVRLLNRSTRTLSLTGIGQRYYRDANALVRQFEELQSNVQRQQDNPGGKLKISAPYDFGDHRLVPGIMRFMSHHPEVDLELHLENRFVDLVEEGFDLAVRASVIPDSALIARRLSDWRNVICGLPDLLERHGMPAAPQDVAAIPCIVDTNLNNWANWPFVQNGKTRSVPVQGRIQVNNAVAGRAAALEGLGLVRAPYPLVEEDIAAGRLKVVLAEFEPDTASLVAIFPHRRHLSATVRALIDHLVEWYK